MEWITIISLIAIGIFLLIAEIIFIPGIFIAGTAGVLLSIWGIYISYEAYGTTVGTVTLIATVLANALALFLTFRGKTWERFSLRESHISKVNEHKKGAFAVGDIGVSISALKPVGKAIINDREIEVTSKGGYIEENVELVVISNDYRKIIVEKTNN